MAMLSAKEVAQFACQVGENKTDKANKKVIISALFAGLFIGFGYYGYLVIAGSAMDPIIGRYLGAFIFPVGIVLIILTGTDLFTGNCLVTMGYLNGCYGLQKVIKNLILVFIGNFIGALLLVIILYFSNMLGNFDVEPTNTLVYLQKLAYTKANLPFSEALFRGILCNILVSLSVYGSYAAKDTVGKILALVLPVALFVISGFEHSVANMFILPMGYMTGGDFTFLQMWENLIPVTLGNVIGGAIIIPLGFHMIYLNQKK
jgi:formate transporter